MIPKLFYSDTHVEGNRLLTEMSSWTVVARTATFNGRVLVLRTFEDIEKFCQRYSAVNKDLHVKNSGSHMDMRRPVWDAVKKEWDVVVIFFEPRSRLRYLWLTGLARGTVAIVLNGDTVDYKQAEVSSEIVVGEYDYEIEAEDVDPFRPASFLETWSAPGLKETSGKYYR